MGRKRRTFRVFKHVLSVYVFPGSNLRLLENETRCVRQLPEQN
jgi:hypothetical protein